MFEKMVWILKECTEVLKRCFKIWSEWEEMFTCNRAKG